MAPKDKGKKKVRGAIQDLPIPLDVQDPEVQNFFMLEDLPLPRDPSRSMWQRTQTRSRTRNMTMPSQTTTSLAAATKFTAMAATIGEMLTTMVLGKMNDIMKERFVQFAQSQ